MIFASWTNVVSNEVTLLYDSYSRNCAKITLRLRDMANLAIIFESSWLCNQPHKWHIHNMINILNRSIIWQKLKRRDLGESTLWLVEISIKTNWGFKFWLYFIAISWRRVTIQKARVQKVLFIHDCFFTTFT